MLRAEYRPQCELTKDMHFITHPELCDFYGKYLGEACQKYGDVSAVGAYFV